MNDKLNYYLKLFSFPLFCLVVFMSLHLVWNIFDLPPTAELLVQVKGWFDVYGLPVLFLSAVVEGMLLVGGYFPGVFVIFVSVLLADNPLEAALAVAVGTTGLLVAHAANYALGRYGWYKLLVRFGMKSSIEDSKEKLITKGPMSIWSTYWLPSMSALTDTAAGIIQMPFRQFILYSIMASIFWNSLVGAIVYIVGEPAMSVVGGGGGTDLKIQLSVVAIWILILLALDVWKKHRDHYSST